MATAIWKLGPRSVRSAHWVAVFLTLTCVLLVLTALLSAHGRPCSRTSLLHSDPRQVEDYFTPRPQGDAATATATHEPTHFPALPHAQLCDPAPDLLILVPSPPGEGRVRDVIRQTWGSAVSGAWPPRAELRRKVALVFLVGQENDAERRAAAIASVLREAATHGDLLVLGGINDTYRNLVHKMLHGLRWAAQRCARARFVLKADSDTFVNVERLLGLLFDSLPPWPSRRVVLGDILCSEPVSRDPASRVHVEVGLYPFPSYPVYARGGTYVLSGDLTGPLVNASRYLAALPPEDAYITGVLGRALSVRHVHVPEVMLGVTCPLSPCVFLLNGQLTATDVSPDLMRALWGTMQAGPDYCIQHASLYVRVCSWVSTLTVRCGNRVGLVS